MFTPKCLFPKVRTLRGALPCILSCALLLALTAGPAAAASQKKAASTPALPSTAAGISMEESVRTTLQEHRSLRAIQENREVIVRERDRAEKGYFPRVDVLGATGYAQNSDSTTRKYGNGTDSDFYPGSRVSATLTQPVWDGFATRSKVRNAEATLNSMSHRVMDNATTLSLDAIITHIDVLRTREIVRLSQENVKRHEQLLRQVIDRQATGADSMADVSQARSRLARAQSQRADALSSMQASEALYYRLTNRMVSARSLAPVPAPAFPYQDSDAVFDVARQNNPKLAALKADIDASKAGKELSEAAYQPNINVEAGPSYVTKGVGGKASEWTQGMDAMVVMRWNVFNSGADKDGVEASSARIRQSRQTMYSFDDDLKNAVENSWISMLTAKEQYKLYTEAARYSGETLEAYKSQFQLGQRSILDVLDAENELYNNAVQAVTARNNIPVSQYRMLALGGILLRQLGVPEKELLDVLPGDQGPANARAAR